MCACGLSIKVVIVFCMLFALLRNSHIRRWYFGCVCVCVFAFASVFVYRCVVVCELTSFFTLPSTEARQQPTWYWACVYVYAPHTHTNKRKMERERESANQTASSLCLFVRCCLLLSHSLERSLALSIVLPAVCVFFAWSYRSFSPMTVSCCRSLSLAFPLPNPSANRVGPPLVAFVVILLLLLLLLLLFLSWAAATKRLSTVFTQLLVVVPLLAGSFPFSLSFRPPLICLLPKSK